MTFRLKWYWQYVRMVPCHWTRWLLCLYMVKRLKKAYSPEPSKLWGWILVYSIGGSRSTMFVEMMVVGWPLTFLRQSKICAPIHLYGDDIEKSFSQWIVKTLGWNIECMIKLVKLLSYCQNFWGYLPLPLGYIHVKIVKSLKVLFSDTAWTVFTRFHIVYIWPSIERVLTVCSNISMPFNKTAAMPI